MIKKLLYKDKWVIIRGLNYKLDKIETLERDLIIKRDK
jgi:hypothetical protein